MDSKLAGEQPPQQIEGSLAPVAEREQNVRGGEFYRKLQISIKMGRVTDHK
jgi:hypothetical protein